MAVSAPRGLEVAVPPDHQAARGEPDTAPGPRRAGGPPSESRGRRFAAVWAVSSGILFLLMGSWSLATPIGGAPDEPAQWIKAASVARGEVLGHHVTGQPAAVIRVTVPSSFADATEANCYAFHPTVPAGCGHGLVGSGRDTTTTTTVGRYPPLYYALVGWPSLWWHSDVAVYLMRFMSALLSAVLLGLALAVAGVFGRSRLLVAGVAVAATPMAIFLGSVVNPSGLEIAAAVCTWTCGLVLVLDHRRLAPPGLVVATAASAMVLVLVRGLSPLWLALAALSMVALVPSALAQLLRWRRVRVAAVVVAVTGAAAVAFILVARTLAVYPGGKRVEPSASEWTIVKLAFGQTNTLVHQFVGDFGWVDTPSPRVVTVLWLLVVAVVVAGGILWGWRRGSVLIVSLAVVSLLLPVAIMASHAKSDGLVWQARDGFPLYVGAILVAGAVAGHARPPRRKGAKRGWRALDRGTGLFVTIVVAVIVAACQEADFVWALRRYTVGLGAVANPFAHVRGGWSPPVPAIPLVVAAGLVAGGYGLWIVRLAGHRPRPSSLPVKAGGPS
jgi:hypothetical protein